MGLLKRKALAAALLLLMVAACVPQPGPLSTPTPTAAAPSPTTGGGIEPSSTPVVITATAASPEPQPSAIVSTAAATTGVPTQAVTEITPGEDTYLDDRSGPAQLMRSYVNALNRREYLRAYSYWRNPQDAAPSFEQFAAGYENTEAVVLTLGQIGGDPGAGQMYYSVPALLEAHTAAGTETYAACYILHLAQPAAQEPPFRSLSIDRGEARLVEEDASAAAQLTSICEDLGLPVGPPVGMAPTGSPENITADVYLDDRSGPAAVLASLFNSVNRKEYARAFSYWAADAAPDYERFRAGYAQTEAVQLLVGDINADAGAGQIYYAVPVVVTAQDTGGQTQAFSGCYFLRLSFPAAQASLPFRPLAIESARLQVVPGGANPAGFLPDSCEP